MQVPFQPTSTAPAPGTTEQGSWEDFLNTAVRGVQSIVQTVQAGRSPAQTGGGYAGTTYPMLGQGGASRGDGGGLVLLLVVLVVFMVAD